MIELCSYCIHTTHTGLGCLEPGCICTRPIFKAVLTQEQIDCIRKIGRDEKNNCTTIGLPELNALCNMAELVFKMNKPAPSSSSSPVKPRGAWRVVSDDNKALMEWRESASPLEPRVGERLAGYPCVSSVPPLPASGRMSEEILLEIERRFVAYPAQARADVRALLIEARRARAVEFPPEGSIKDDRGIAK